MIQVESKCHTFFSLAKFHKFYKHITIYLYIYIKYKSFSATLDKGLRKNTPKKGMEKLENID